jgi:hypothetical protein
LSPNSTEAIHLSETIQGFDFHCLSDDQDDVGGPFRRRRRPSIRLTLHLPSRQLMPEIGQSAFSIRRWEARRTPALSFL